ncbi:MAG: glycosyltransferase family 2 protein [Anaerolineae bacterium]
MDLAIVILNWNVRDLLRQCLRSLEAARAATSAAVAVIVVDNASTDGSADMVRAEFPRVNVICAPRNLGFTAGNNLALRALGFSPRSGEAARTSAMSAEVAAARASLALSAPPPYVMLLNPDTEIVGDALTVMRDYMARHPDVGLLGPRLRYADGSVQPSRRRFPNRQTAFLESTLLQQWWPNGSALRRFYVADRPDDIVQDVDWITGACMLARGSALAEVGLLDEGFFMYSEEVDWGRRFRLAGWRIAYLPTAEVMHYEGRSSEQVVARRHIYFQTSKVRYYRKWDGRPMAETLRLFLLATYAWQLGEESAKWLVGHKRSMRWERMRAYTQVLRSRLRS